MPPVAEPKPAEQIKPAEAAPGAAASAALEGPSFTERMTLAKEKKKEKEKEEAATAAPKPEDGKPVEKPAAAPAKPEKPAPAAKKKVVPLVVPPPEPVVDAREIAKVVATEVATALKPVAATAKSSEPDPLNDLDDDEKGRVAILERMEKDHGDRYKGLPKKYAASLVAAKKYQKEWEAANKGKKFDAEDEEHNEFYANNDVDWSDDHYADARVAMAIDKANESQSRKQSEEKKSLEKRNQLLEATPAITKRRSETAKLLFASLGDDYKAVLNADGSINGAEVTRLIEEDPLRNIAFESASRVEAFAEEFYKIANQLVEFDAKNPNHKFIEKYVADQEALMKAQPDEGRLNAQGQWFATADEYLAMTPARRKYYWRFTEKDLADLYAEDEAQLAKKAIADEEIRVRKAAERRGAKFEAQPTTAATPGAKAEEQQAAPVEKPVSPASTVGQRPAPVGVSPAGGGESKSDSFLKRWGVV